MTLSIGYVRSLCERATITILNASQKFDGLYSDDETTTSVEFLSEMTGIPIISNYDNISFNTLVIKNFIDRDITLDYPGLTVLGLVVKKGIKHDFCIIEGCSQDVRFV